MSPTEGELPHGVEHITTAKLDHRQWVKETAVKKLRKMLQVRDGVSVAQITDAIRAQVPTTQPVTGAAMRSADAGGAGNGSMQWETWQQKE